MGKRKAVDPWIWKELNKQEAERRLTHLRENGRQLPDMQGRPYTISYYGGWGLIKRTADPDDMVSFFTITFKARVRVGKIAEILVQALDHINIEDLK